MLPERAGKSVVAMIGSLLPLLVGINRTGPGAAVRCASRVPGSRLPDAICIRDADCRADNCIAWTEYLIEVRSHRPPCQQVSSKLPLCFSSLEMVIVGKNQHFSPARSRDTIYSRLFAIIESRMPSPSKILFSGSSFLASAA